MIDRLTAALCALLMMFYAATVPAKATDQLQHSPALMVLHEHSVASFGLDAVHDDYDDHEAHHRQAPDTDDRPGDHLAGGHHHHGDSGPNLLVPAGAAAPSPISLGGLHGFRADRPIAGLMVGGPDRPPRLTSLNV